MVLYENRQRAETFGDDADRYDRSRPSYPPELIAAVLQDAPRRVLDAGCGTGIAARLLAGDGLRASGQFTEPEVRSFTTTPGS